MIGTTHATARLWRSCLAVMLPAACVSSLACAAADDGRDGYVVRGADGKAAAYALITARSTDGRVARTVWSDGAGRFDLPALPDSTYRLELRSAVAESSPRTVVDVTPSTHLQSTVELGPLATRTHPRGSSFLGQLPDGERKRSLIVDCGGCHVFDSLRMRNGGGPRSRTQWQEALGLMLSLYGPNTGFPIISTRDVDADATWLADALEGAEWPIDTPWPVGTLANIGAAELMEWAMPQPMDLAHDVVVHPSGEILVTGMFTHVVYRFDPLTGSFATEPIPVPNANPRAIDVDADGRWLLLLGAPGQIARFDPATGEWESWSIGMYPHSVAPAPDGGVWYNGHFTHEPELIGVLDPEGGRTVTQTVVSSPTPSESTIPYGLRIARNGVVWGTQLRGNRLVRHDPATGHTRTIPMPEAHSGPRRPDVGPDGSVWIPEFGANRLTRFDPVTESFESFDFPAPDAAPYVVRVDQRRGTVWIGTGHADVIGAFDPAAKRFTLYPLPTRGALIRHLDIDERSGDVWATYSASPGIPGALVRLRPGS